MFRRAFLVAAFTAFTLASAGAASFDCATARAPDEAAICKSCDLAQLDVKMATLYGVFNHLVGMGQRGAFQDEQREWLSRRASCGADTACLTSAYRTRIREIEGALEDIYSRGPF